MELNHYALEVVARSRLDGLRADAERRRQVAFAARPVHWMRAAVGRTLIRAGRRLLAEIERPLPSVAGRP
jgi:hypothetical protein